MNGSGLGSAGTMVAEGMLDVRLVAVYSKLRER